MSGMEAAIQRIRSIESRFHPIQTIQIQSNNKVNFSDVLSAEQSKLSTSRLPGTEDVAKIINVAANKYGVDPRLAMAVAKAESNYNQNVVSSAGAVGVMQLMPETAAAIGVKDIYDVRENIDGGVKYLKQMLNLFDGNFEKAVAAYNAGPNAVIEYHGVPPYAETKAYVSNVLANYNS